MPSLSVSHRSQLQRADCLAACAAMVLDYLDVNADYQELIELLRIGEYGTSYTNLPYLSELGVKVLVAKGDIEILRGCLTRKLPPIVFVNTGQLSYWNETTGHALIVVGIEGNQMFVNDPAFPDAPKEIAVDEFMLAWIDMNQFYGLIERED